MLNIPIINDELSIRLTRYVKFLGKKKIGYSRQIIGISKLCTKHQILPLSTMSYQGSTKAMAIAVIKGLEFEMTGIKDQIMFGFVTINWFRICKKKERG